MNLRNNKGYTGIDISVAMIIILIFIPTIFGIVYNMQKTRARTERQVVAVNIATDILEIVKSLNYENVDVSEDGELNNLLKQRYTLSSYNSNIDSQEENFSQYSYYTLIGTNNEHYRIQVGILKHVPEGEENIDTAGYVKQVKVIVTYPVGNTTKNINISTVVKNEN